MKIDNSLQFNSIIITITLDFIIFHFATKTLAPSQQPPGIFRN